MLFPARSLRILIVADPQDIDTPQPAMLSLLNASLDAAEPDLVVFLGDMIHGRDLRGEDRVKKAIDAAISPVIERGIPFALVFGNHDEECGISKEEQLRMYQSYPGCLAVDGEDLPGCGNYYIVVENPVQPESPVVLWFMDSGSYAEEGKGTYGYVTEEQNEWMLSAYEKLCEKYASPVSYVFQHIPVPQVYNMIKEVPFGTSGAVTCYGPNFGKWYVLDDEYIWAGHMGEGPCSSEYDSGEFAAWKKMNVKAAFFGHDHLNDYCGTYEGIDMVTTSGVGFYLYGRGDEHGTRLVTLNAENPAGYETKMLYYKDLVSEPLPGLFVSSLGVMLRKYVFMILAALVVLIVVIVLVIRWLVKRHKRKKLKRMIA
ncbi:metallophosphoesterase [Clostridiales bacterium FE2010]|nr:metallophosphoesterase [Clostridiales bacterium FE2010]